MAHIIPVKYMYGGSVDALYCHPTYPVLSATASGCGISLLDACLINGFGEVSLSSLTINSSGVATATSIGHGYNKTPLVILISGADQEAINGEWELTGFTSNTLTFDASDSGLTNTTITGTLKLKVAPLGWEKVFSDVPNYIAVYRSPHPFSRRHFLRIDDSDNSSISTYPYTYARGYETMESAQDVGFNGYPMTSSLSRGVGISRNIVTNAGIYGTSNGANISWTLIGTSRQFYLATNFGYGNVNNFRTTFFFGDMISYIPGDFGASLIQGCTVFNTGSSPGDCTNFGNYTGRYAARNLTRVIPTTSQRTKLVSSMGCNTTGVMGQTSTVPFTDPDIYCNKMFVDRPVLVSDESYPSYLRGEQPGMATCLNAISALSIRYEPNVIFTTQGERFMHMPVEQWVNMHGNFLLSIDTDWNTPFYD